MCRLSNPGIPPKTLLVTRLSLGPAGDHCALLSLRLLIQLKKRTTDITKFQVEQTGYISQANQDPLPVRILGLLGLGERPCPIIYALLWVQE